MTGVEIVAGTEKAAAKAATGTEEHAATKGKLHNQILVGDQWLVPGAEKSITAFKAAKAQAIKVGSYNGQPLDQGGRTRMWFDEQKVVHNMSDSQAEKVFRSTGVPTSYAHSS